jgi:hypothetical protein
MEEIEIIEEKEFLMKSKKRKIQEIETKPRKVPEKRQKTEIVDNNFLKQLHLERLKRKKTKIPEKITKEEQLRERKNKERNRYIVTSKNRIINSDEIKKRNATFHIHLEYDKIGRKALELTNSFREKHKLKKLDWSKEIAQVSFEHSQNMGLKKVKFGHDGFDERSKKFPFDHISSGENVAMNNTNENEVSVVAVNGWINSPGHRKNLLGNFDMCGIGVYKNENNEYYLCQMFAKI